MSRFRAGCLGTAVAVTLVYANHFRNAFQFDDSHTVESNLFVRDLRNIPRFFTDARTFSSLPSNQSYRPVVTTTLAVDYALGGLDPLPFHLDSFAWFLLECLLLAALFRRILNSDWGALFGAALVGLHPANAETVNYVIARSDVLSALGAIACVWLWAASYRARRLHLYLVPAVLGVLAKSQGAMAAPLLFLYSWRCGSWRALRAATAVSPFERPDQSVRQCGVASRGSLPSGRTKGGCDGNSGSTLRISDPSRIDPQTLAR